MHTITGTKTPYNRGKLDHATYRQLGQNIAIALGNNWELTIPQDLPNYLYLRDKSGQGISLYLPEQVNSVSTEGKLLVQGLWDAFPPSAQEFIPTEIKNRKITIGSSRGIKAIVSSIEERFLDDYTKAFNETQLRYQQATEAQQKLIRTAHSLAKILGESPEPDPLFPRRYLPKFSAKISPSETFVSGEVLKNGKVNLQIKNLSPDAARNLVYILSNPSLYENAS